MLLGTFLILIGLAIYPVVIYPILVMILARIAPDPWREAPATEPFVHVITVFNEEQRIRTKLENALSLETPHGALQIVVVDDGSTDGTEAIVREFADRGVIWIGCERRGKEYAQLEAIRLTSEPILVFSDASTTMQPDAIVHLLKPFADRQVAAVSGTDRIEGQSGTGEDIYVRYEMGLRRAESLAGSLVGLSGCFFALRREVAEGLLPDVPSDMGGALRAIQLGRRAVAQDDAICTYSATPEVDREFARKRRTALRGLRCLWFYPRSLTAGGALISWQVLSHKWMRFAIPWFQLAAVVVALVAAVRGQLWGQLLSLAVLTGAGAGLLALVAAPLRRLKPFRVLAFLIVSTTAVLAAWIDILTGRTSVKWTPTRRPGVHR